MKQVDPHKTVLTLPMSGDILLEDAAVGLAVDVSPGEASHNERGNVLHTLQQSLRWAGDTDTGDIW